MDCINTSGIFFLLFCSLHFLTVRCQSVCKTTSSPCKCDTDDGTIDLSPIDHPTGNPMFYQVYDSAGQSGYYSYNPCTPYTLNPPADPNGCVNVLGCQQVQQSGTESYALGAADSPIWKKDSGGNYVIHLKATDPIDNLVRTMTITLTCDPTATDPTFEPSADTATPLTYPMKLTSKYACPTKQPPATTPRSTVKPSPSKGGLSFGSILCIIFATSVAIYLVAGCLYNYFRKGSRGQEIIPNVELWKEFPFYVKDGAVFVFYKIRGGSRAGYQDLK